MIPSESYRSDTTSLLLRRDLLLHAAQRENAGDGGTAPDHRIEPHRTTVQLDEGAHDREAETGAAVLGAERMALEPIEHALADRVGDARTAVGDAENDRA